MILGPGYFFPAYLLLSGILLSVLWALKADRITQLLFLLAAAITSWRFVATSPLDFASDIYGHLGYIHHIATTGSLPTPPFNWQTHQPPLFYFLAAVGRNIAAYLELEPIHGARFVTVLFYYAFAITSAEILRYVIRQREIYILCLILVLFWPASAHTSVKITNDVPESFFCILTFYFCLHWLMERHPKLLGWALTSAGLAMFTKGNGLVAIAMVVICAAWKCFKDGKGWIHEGKKYICLGMAVLLLGSGINFGRILYWKLTDDPDVHFLINRQEDYLGTFEYVGNEPAYYLSLKLQDFLNRPFADFNNDVPSAYFFWNISLKTLLFDDLQHNAPQVACFINALLLIYLLSILYLTFVTRKISDNQRTLWLAGGTICMAFAMVMIARIQIPISYQASSRYIYFVVPLLALIYGISLEKFLAFRQSPKKYIAVLPALFMAVSSINFILAQL